MSKVKSPETMEPVSVSSAKQLLQEVGVQIDGIMFFKVSAEIDADFAGVAPEDLSPEPSYLMRVRHKDARISVRLQTEVKTVIGRVEVDAAINYLANQPVVPTREALTDFSNNVGVMALLPYIREAVSSMSQRVFGQTLLMPVIQLGQLTFAVPDLTEPQIEPESTGND